MCERRDLRRAKMIEALHTFRPCEALTLAAVAWFGCNDRETPPRCPEGPRNETMMKTMKENRDGIGPNLRFTVFGSCCLVWVSDPVGWKSLLIRIHDQHVTITPAWTRKSQCSNFSQHFVEVSDFSMLLDGKSVIRCKKSLDNELSESHQPMGSNGHFPSEYNSPQRVESDEFMVCLISTYSSIVQFISIIYVLPNKISQFKNGNMKCLDIAQRCSKRSLFSFKQLKKLLTFVEHSGGLIVFIFRIENLCSLQSYTMLFEHRSGWMSRKLSNASAKHGCNKRVTQLAESE